MLSYEEAKAIAYDFINEKYSLSADDRISIIDDGSGENTDSWIFQYNSQKYIETSDPLFMMQVGYPIVVNKIDGSCALRNERPQNHGF